MTSRDLRTPLTRRERIVVHALVLVAVMSVGVGYVAGWRRGFVVGHEAGQAVYCSTAEAGAVR